MSDEKNSFTFHFHAPVGQQIAHVDKIEAHFDKDMNMQVMNPNQPSTQPIETEVVTEDNVKLFRYISPFVTDEKERKEIHKVIVNLVNSDFRLSAICTQLKDLIKQNKITLYVSTTEQYNELVRLGLPADKEGYSQKNYENYMSEQKK